MTKHKIIFPIWLFFHSLYCRFWNWKLAYDMDILKLQYPKEYENWIALGEDSLAGRDFRFYVYMRKVDKTIMNTRLFRFLGHLRHQLPILWKLSKHEYALLPYFGVDSFKEIESVKAQFKKFLKILEVDEVVTSSRTRDFDPLIRRKGKLK